MRRDYIVNFACHVCGIVHDAIGSTSFRCASKREFAPITIIRLSSKLFRFCWEENGTGSLSNASSNLNETAHLSRILPWSLGGVTCRLTNEDGRIITIPWHRPVNVARSDESFAAGLMSEFNRTASSTAMRQKGRSTAGDFVTIFGQQLAESLNNEAD